MEKSNKDKCPLFNNECPYFTKQREKCPYLNKDLVFEKTGTKCPLFTEKCPYLNNLKKDCPYLNKAIKTNQ